LYLTGAIPVRPMVAIVGTRHPTPEAAEFARILARDIVGHGFAVASGGAAGIDTAAHQGALAAGGATLVVAPAGWNEPYPQSNRDLFKEVVSKGGGYLSLVEPNQRVLMHQFFARNAVLVAMCKATVVVQAPLRSGARNSAHVARSIGRMLFVVPSAPWVERGAGCVLELRLGARPIGCLGDLLSSLSAQDVHGSRDPLQLELPLKEHRSDGELAPMVKAITDGSATLDSLCLRLGWNTPKVQSALLHLTMSGRIRMTSAGRIEIISS